MVFTVFVITDPHKILSKSLHIWFHQDYLATFFDYCKVKHYVMDNMYLWAFAWAMKLDWFTAHYAKPRQVRISKCITVLSSKVHL